jgi:polysaccharide pyruvyl transferase WcaK-like protein
VAGLADWAAGESTQRVKQPDATERPTMTRVFLYHGEAYGNLGDEAMLLAAVERIRRRLPDVSFVVHRRPGAPLPDIGQVDWVDPPSEIVSEFLGRRRSPRRLWDALTQCLAGPLPRRVARRLSDPKRMPDGWSRLLEQLRRCDAVYMVGAANLNDYAVYPCVLPKCALVRAAAEMGIPVVASAQTVGPVSQPWVRRMIRELVDACESFSIRDGGVSYQHLELSGRAAEAIPIVGDEAFSLAPADSAAVEAFLKSGGVDVDRPFGVLQFRPTDYTADTSGHYRKLVDALDSAEAGRQFVFLPMSAYLCDDRSAGQAVRAAMRDPARLIVLPRPDDARMARGIVAAAEWAMSLSYHVQVFAMAAGRPMAALTSGPYYRVKAEGMRMLLGDRLPVCDLATATTASLVSLINSLDDCRGRTWPAALDARQRIQLANDLPIEALAAAVSESGPDRRGGTS